jgi:hypothetical protein
MSEKELPANDTMKFAKMTLEGTLFLDYASCKRMRIRVFPTRISRDV